MRLQFQLTDLLGTPKSAAFTANFFPGEDHGEAAPFRTRQGGQVTIPNNDSRLGQLVVSMFEPAAAMLTPGDTAVKALYGPHLVLWGIILVPTADFDAGTVSCTLHDWTIRFKHRNLRYGDVSVTATLNNYPGIPLDGSGYRTLISDSERPAGGNPGTGVLVPGIDTVPAQPALPAGIGGAPPVPPVGSLYVGVQRGDLAWDQMTGMTQAADGFEVDFRPFDTDHPSLSGGAWVAGKTIEVITKPSLGVDRSQGNGVVDPVVFIHGHGGFHLVSAPDAGQMKNYSVQTQPGGQYDPLDIYGIAKVRDDDSINKYGIWEDWHAASQIEGNNFAYELTLLNNRGKAVVTAYATPPKYITAKCDTDSPCGYQFMTAFDVSDVVTVYAKRGYVIVKENVRIIQAIINQKDQDGNVSIDLTFAPYLLAGSSQVIE